MPQAKSIINQVTSLNSGFSSGFPNFILAYLLQQYVILINYLTRSHFIFSLPKKISGLSSYCNKPAIQNHGENCPKILTSHIKPGELVYNPGFPIRKRHLFSLYGTPYYKSPYQQYRQPRYHWIKTNFTN